MYILLREKKRERKYNTISAIFVSQFPMIGSLYTKVGFFRSYDRPFDISKIHGGNTDDDDNNNSNS